MDRALAKKAAEIEKDLVDLEDQKSRIEKFLVQVEQGEPIQSEFRSGPEFIVGINFDDGPETLVRDKLEEIEKHIKEKETELKSL